MKNPNKMLHTRPLSNSEDQVPILQPPPQFDRSDSMSSDTKFDIILASLQNLAYELEKDFDQDEELVNPNDNLKPS